MRHPQVVLDRYFSAVVLFLRAQFCHDLPASGCTGPLARTKAVGLILAEVDECDGPITTVIRVAFERSYGGNCRVVVDVGGIGRSKWLRVMET
jgi:hypothetical protein